MEKDAKQVYPAGPFPTPICARITPVPVQDGAWKEQNVITNETKDLSVLPIPRETFLSIGRQDKVIPIVPTLEFRHTEWTDKLGRMYLLAKKELEEKKWRLTARLETIDDYIEGNIKGYKPMKTGAQFYKLYTMQGTQLFNRSIFGTEGILNIEQLVKFMLLTGDAQTKPQATKDFLVFLLRIFINVYCILNDRVLCQTPEAGEKYQEHLPPYLYVMYPERDWECQKERLEQIRTDMNISYDLFAEASRSTIAEFTYACTLFLQAFIEDHAVPATDKWKLPVVAEINKFVSKSLKEHWRKYFDRLNVRIVPISNLCDFFNTIDSRLRPNGQEAAKVFRVVYSLAQFFFTLQLKEMVSGTSKIAKQEQRIVDIHRLKFPHLTHWTEMMKESATKTVNWTACLSAPQLLTWLKQDPYDMDFQVGTRKRIQKSLDGTNLAEVRVYELRRIVCLKGSMSTSELPESACRLLENQLRPRYAMVVTPENRLCVAPPRPWLSTYGTTAACERDYFFHESSPVNLTLPALRWLDQQAKDWKEPAPDDQQRRRLRKMEVDILPNFDHWDLYAAGRYVSFDGSAIPSHYRQLSCDLSLPLVLRLAIEADLQFTRHWGLEPLPREREQDEYEGDDDDEATRLRHRSKGPEPLQYDLELGSHLPESFQKRADFIREHHPEIKLDEKGCLLSGDDEMKLCLEVYRLYLQGCCLFYQEEDVFGYLHKYLPSFTKSEKLKRLQWGQLIWHAMCMRTVRNTVKYRCPEARSALVPILSTFAEEDTTMESLITGPKSVCRSRTAWASFLAYMDLQVETNKPEDLKVAKTKIIDAMTATRLEDEQVTLPGPVSFIDNCTEDHVFLPRLIKRENRDKRLGFKDNFPRVCQFLSERFYRLVILPALYYIHLRRPMPVAPVGSASWLSLYGQALHHRPNLSQQLSLNMEAMQRKVQGSEMLKKNADELAVSIENDVTWYYRQDFIDFLLSGKGTLVLKPKVATALANKRLTLLQRQLLCDQLSSHIAMTTLEMAVIGCASPQEAAAFFGRFYKYEAIQATVEMLRSKTTLPAVALLLQELDALVKRTPLVPAALTPASVEKAQIMAAAAAHAFKAEAKAVLPSSSSSVRSLLASKAAAKKPPQQPKPMVFVPQPDDPTRRRQPDRRNTDFDMEEDDDDSKSGKDEKKQPKEMKKKKPETSGKEEKKQSEDVEMKKPGEKAGVKRKRDGEDEQEGSSPKKTKQDKGTFTCRGAEASSDHHEAPMKMRANQQCCVCDAEMCREHSHLVNEETGYLCFPCMAGLASVPSDDVLSK